MANGQTTAKRCEKPRDGVTPTLAAAAPEWPIIIHGGFCEFLDFQPTKRFTQQLALSLPSRNRPGESRDGSPPQKRKEKKRKYPTTHWLSSQPNRLIERSLTSRADLMLKAG